MALKACEYCGSQFERRTGRFCSKRCFYESNVTPLPVRLAQRVQKQERDDCWEYQGARTKSGYGLIVDRKTKIYAHRLCWELTNGPIPDGFQVLHRCDNPPCCNLAHLFLGTNADNVADKVRKGRARGISQPGEKNPDAKLTEQQVRDIRATYAAGSCTLQQLAHRFSVNKSTIWLIVKRKKWGWLPQSP